MNEKIYEQLKRKILFLEFQPGEVIDEKKIAAEFKVSRTPIREVLQRLEWEELIEIIPRGVISVATLEYTKLKQIYFMRVQMESLAGKLAAANGYPKHIAQLQSILESVVGKNGEISLPELVDFDLIFREVFYEATGNAVLKQMSDSLYEQTQRVWMLNVKRDETSSVMQRDIDLLIEELKAAIETIEKKDHEAGEAKRREIFIRQIKRTTEYFLNEIEAY